MTSISLPGASGSCFVKSVVTCWACVAVANPKVKINTERMSFFMLCIASVLSVMCCDNRLTSDVKSHRLQPFRSKRRGGYALDEKVCSFSADTPKVRVRQRSNFQFRVLPFYIQWRGPK